VRFGAGCLGGHFDDLWCKLISELWMKIGESIETQR